MRCHNCTYPPLQTNLLSHYTHTKTAMSNQPLLGISNNAVWIGHGWWSFTQEVGCSHYCTTVICTHITTVLVLKSQQNRTETEITTYTHATVHTGLRTACTSRVQVWQRRGSNSTHPCAASKPEVSKRWAGLLHHSTTTSSVTQWVFNAMNKNQGRDS